MPISRFDLQHTRSKRDVSQFRVHRETKSSQPEVEAAWDRKSDPQSNQSVVLGPPTVQDAPSARINGAPSDPSNHSNDHSPDSTNADTIESDRAQSPTQSTLDAAPHTDDASHPLDESRALLMPVELPEADRQERSPKNDEDTQLSPNVGETRRDLITGDWTVFATARSRRPNQFGEGKFERTKNTACPFCFGNENSTPDPVFVARLDDDDNSASSFDWSFCENSDPWSLRVVPNLFPAVGHGKACDCTSGQAMAGESGDSYRSKLFPSEPALGGHEVVIEAPQHVESLSDLNRSQINLLFVAYAERIKFWRAVPGIRHVSVFKNVGREAGASLPHSHSQLIATNRVPAIVQNVVDRLQTHQARTGACLQCDLVRAETEDGSRVIGQSEKMIAFCPYSSRFPLQVRITSKQHQACFGDLPQASLAEASRITLKVVRWLEAIRPGTAYNLLLHTCPIEADPISSSPIADSNLHRSHHWAIDIFPRMSRLAGFELATGAMINPVFPEAAATAFRQEARKTDPRWVLR